MGAGAKCDPTRIQIGDISYTSYDPLARSVRRRLRRQGVPSGIPVVYSNEVPGDFNLSPHPGGESQKGDMKSPSLFGDFRQRTPPVLGMSYSTSESIGHILFNMTGSLPCIFGLHIATYIICDLAKKPIRNRPAIKNRRKLYKRLLKDLLHRESNFAGEQIK